MNLGAVRPANWVGADLTADNSWRLEIGSATAKALAAHACGEGRDSLPPELSQLAEVLRRELHPRTGRGCAVVTGLPTSGRSERDAAELGLGLARLIGTPVSQTAALDYVSHVRTTGHTYSPAERRGYRSDSELRFHTDYSHVGVLVCIADAAEGGDSLLVSSARVLEVLGEERPDLVDVLRTPYPLSRLDEEGPNEPAYSLHPLLCASAGADPLLFFNPTLIRVAVDHDGAPPLSPAQVEAVEAVEEIASRPETVVRFRLRPGDALFFNNYLVLHARTSFCDALPPAPRRHLLRIWMVRADLFPADARLFEFRYGNLGILEPQ